MAAKIQELEPKALYELNHLLALLPTSYTELQILWERELFYFG